VKRIIENGYFFNENYHDLMNLAQSICEIMMQSHLILSHSDLSFQFSLEVFGLEK
jgi:hypothetical protein